MKTAHIATLAGVFLALGACVQAPGPWRMVKKPVTTAGLACTAFTSSIYFEQDSVALTPEAKMVLANARAQARGCEVRSVRVIGLADAVGASEANLALSRRRADTVSAALATHGFGQAEFDLAALGETGATAPSGAVAPLRRRADIVFDLAPRTR